MVSYGYTGNGQYLAWVKHNATANTSGVLGYAMDISDFFLGESALSNVHTYPTYANLSFLGWAFCSVSVGNADAIYFHEDGNGRIYNSVISSYSQYALFLDGSTVINNTSGTPELQFSYNSFHQINNNPKYNHNGSWTGCSLDMDSWISGGVPCEESGNQFTVTTLGLGTSDVCVTCPTQPDFSLGTNTLDAPVFNTWDSGSVFDHPNHRGAFGASPWVTTGWADFCPQSFDYCL